MKTPRSILVLGYAGFLGRRLCSRLGREFPAARLSGAGRRPTKVPGVLGLRADLRDRAAARRIVTRTRPDWIFHLAAPPSSENTVDMLEGHLLPAARLLEAAEGLPGRPRIVLAGSAAEYGAIAPKRLPVDEEEPLRPINPYGAAKAAQTHLAGVYARRGVDVMVARLFNVLGPGTPPHMALGSFVRQVVDIEAGRLPPILRTGDLTPKRDFIDVEDAAGALIAVARRGKAGRAYNLCSGRSVSILELVRLLLKLSRRPIRLKTDPSRLRKADIPDMRGNPARARAELGWKSGVSPEESLRAMLLHERLTAS